MNKLINEIDHKINIINIKIHEYNLADIMRPEKIHQFEAEFIRIIYKKEDNIGWLSLLSDHEVTSFLDMLRYLYKNKRLV